MTTAVVPPVPTATARIDMYPFAEVRWAFDRIWEAVADRVGWVPDSLTWDAPANDRDRFHGDHFLIGQTCGWPLVSRLRNSVRVVGAFSASTSEGDGCTYRSVLVARRGLNVERVEDLAGATAAVNSTDSLSGWVSLIAAVHGPMQRWQGAVVTSGGHLNSIEAVRSGLADVASIDSVTLELVRRHRRHLLEGVAEVGLGPRVPCLPLVANASMSDAHLRELRMALVDAALDPLVEPAARAMVTVGFVPLDLEHYLYLEDLAPVPR